MVDSNIVGNGENAGYRHFLLFQQCFQKPVLPEPQKPGIVWEGVKIREQNILNCLQRIRSTECLQVVAVTGLCIILTNIEPYIMHVHISGGKK